MADRDIERIADAQAARVWRPGEPEPAPPPAVPVAPCEVWAAAGPKPARIEARTVINLLKGIL